MRWHRIHTAIWRYQGIVRKTVRSHQTVSTSIHTAVPSPSVLEDSSNSAQRASTNHFGTHTVLSQLLSVGRRLTMPDSVYRLMRRHRSISCREHAEAWQWAQTSGKCTSRRGTKRRKGLSSDIRHPYTVVEWACPSTLLIRLSGLRRRVGPPRLASESPTLIRAMSYILGC